MVANDAGGDELHNGVSTMCSYSPPPMAHAIERQRRIIDHSVRVAGTQTSSQRLHYDMDQLGREDSNLQLPG